MSKEIKNVVSVLGAMTKVDSKEVISSIMEWNKDKFYPVSIIDIQVTSKGVVDNSEEVGKLVDIVVEYAEDVIKNTLDIETVLEAKKTISELEKFVTETRKIQTNPLKDVVGHFTPHENRLNGLSSKFNDKIDAINEKTYKVAEKFIREYFDEYLKEKELVDVVSMEAFADFIENKRKTKIFTAKGDKLTKAFTDSVAKVVDDVAKPILEAKELEAKKALQSKQFESYLDGIPAEGSSELLDASIKSLMRLKESVSELYPDIIESCNRSIENKIARCNQAITSNKAIAEKEAIQNADGELLEKFESLKGRANDMTIEVEDLKTIKGELSSLYPLMTFAENRDKVKALGQSIANRIVSAEVAESTPVSVVDSVEVSPCDLVPGTYSYFLDIEDLEVLAGIEVVANSEEEAREKFVESFRTHLEMIELITKDV